MGIEPFLVGSASTRSRQRLLAPCVTAAASLRAHGAGTARRQVPLDRGEPLPTLYRPGGCNRRANAGYRGRMALHE